MKIRVLVFVLAFLCFGLAQGQSSKATPETLFKEGQYSQVVNALSSRIETHNRSELILLGRAHSRLNNPSAAIKVFQIALAKNPKDLEAKVLIGIELHKQKKDKEAILSMKEALEINPRFVPAYNELVKIYELRKNKYELRMLYLDLVKNVGPKAPYLSKLCELTALDGLYDLAFEYCARAIKSNPQDERSRVYRALALRDTGKKEAGLKALKSAAEQFSKSDFALVTYAQALESEKNFLTAFQYYQKALAIKSNSVPALVGLGSSGVEIQKFKESIEAFSQACQIDRSTMTSFRRALSVLRSLKMSDWEQKFEQALSKCP